MGCCFSKNHQRLYSFIKISDINDGANILLINSNDQKRYYIWYDETENITIGMLINFLKSYLQTPKHFKINQSYFGTLRYTINARYNMTVNEYISFCKMYSVYKFFYLGIPYIPII